MVALVALRAMHCLTYIDGHVAADTCAGEPIMVRGNALPANMDTGIAVVRCSGPASDPLFSPRPGYIKQVGGECGAYTLIPAYIPASTPPCIPA